MNDDSHSHQKSEFNISAIGAHEEFDIPGLDFCRCARCGQWVPTDNQMNWLEGFLQAASSTKMAVEIAAQIKSSNQRREKCQPQS